MYRSISAPTSTRVSTSLPTTVSRSTWASAAPTHSRLRHTHARCSRSGRRSGGAAGTMGGDVLPLPRLFADGMASRDWKPWTLKDGSVCLVPGRFDPVEGENGALDLVFQGVPQFQHAEGTATTSTVSSCRCRPSKASKQLEEILPALRTHRAFNWAEAELEIMAEWGKRAHEETDYAVLGDPYTLSFYQPGFELFGYEKFFLFLAAEPELVHCWMDFLDGIPPGQSDQLPGGSRRLHPGDHHGG